jgi:hypothetical protein
MIPMRTSTIFKSRWMALLWAAGIIWFALSVAGTGDSKAASNASANETTDVTGAQVDDQQVKTLFDRLRG